MKKLAKIPNSPAIEYINKERAAENKPAFVPGAPIKRTNAKSNSIYILMPDKASAAAKQPQNTPVPINRSNTYDVHDPVCYCADCKKTFHANIDITYKATGYIGYEKGDILNINKLETECPECHASKKLAAVFPSIDRTQTTKYEYQIRTDNLMTYTEQTEENGIPVKYTRNTVNEMVRIPIIKTDSPLSPIIKQSVISETMDMQNRNIYVTKQILPEGTDLKNINPADFGKIIKTASTQTELDEMIKNDPDLKMIFESSTDPFMYPEYRKNIYVENISNSRQAVLFKTIGDDNKYPDLLLLTPSQPKYNYFRLYNYITEKNRTDTITYAFDDEKNSLLTHRQKQRNKYNSLLHDYFDPSTKYTISIDGINISDRAAIYEKIRNEIISSEKTALILDTEAKKDIMSKYLIANHFIPQTGKDENGDPVYDEFYADWNRNKLLFADYKPMCSEKNSPQSYQKAIAMTVMITKYPAAYAYASSLALNDFRTTCMNRGLSEYEKASGIKRPEKTSQTYTAWVAEAKKTFDLQEIMNRPEMQGAKSKIFRDKIDVIMDQLSACDNAIKTAIKKSILTP